MHRVKFKKNEIDFKKADEIKQEIIGNLIIRDAIKEDAKNDLADVSLVYDNNTEEFDGKVTNSINDYYNMLEAKPFIDFIQKANNMSNLISYKEGEVKSHVSNINRDNMGRGR